VPHDNSEAGIANDKSELRALLKKDLNKLFIEKSLIDRQLIEQLEGVKIFAFNIKSEEELYRLIHWGVKGAVAPSEMQKAALKAYQEIEPKQLYTFMKSDCVTLIDVRPLKDYEEERLENALLSPLDSFCPQHIAAPKDKKLVFYCQVGTRSDFAAKEFLAARSDHICYHLKGGLYAWKDLGLPTIR
jgi:rhodanese-related sulfurtransferase